MFNNLDLDEEEREELKEKFFEILEKESFAEFYAFAESKLYRKIEVLSTEGKWQKYDKGTDPFILEKDLENQGTGWCTASGSAPDHLDGGDFYVYYIYSPEELERKEKGEKVEPTKPAIAIRMLNGQVYEVRGIEANQNLSPELVDIAAEKYRTLPGGDKFEKKREDMKRLTEIYNRFKSDDGESLKEDVELSPEEVEFLYELKGRKIEGFGNQKDSRIDKILEIRDKRQDLEKIYGEGAVALSPEEINENTRYYYGDLDEDYLDILKNKIRNPFEMSGNLNLVNLQIVEGLTLPQRIGGHLILENLTTAKDLILSQTVGGYLNLSGLITAKDLILPQTVSASLRL